jgi:hypothetical protein
MTIYCGHWAVDKRHGAGALYKGDHSDIAKL